LSPSLQLLADSTGQTANTTVIYLTGVPPPATPSPLIGWAIGLAAVVGAAGLAHRRFIRGSADPRRTVRILAAGLAASLALALMESPRDWMAGEPIFLVRLIGRLVFFTASSSALFAGLDLVLDLAAPRRRRTWLLAGVPLFAALLPSAIGLAGLWQWTPMFENGGPLPAALAGATAGLVWWSCLPIWDARLAYVFE
jgi:hypothetical protein